MFFVLFFSFSPEHMFGKGLQAVGTNYQTEGAQWLRNAMAETQHCAHAHTHTHLKSFLQTCDWRESADRRHVVKTLMNTGSHMVKESSTQMYEARIHTLEKTLRTALWSNSPLCTAVCVCV